MTGAGPETILATLVGRDVEFVVIGGLAAVAHGSRRVTRDIDVFVQPESANLARLESALAELGAVQLVEKGAERPIRPADMAMVGIGTTLHTRSPSGRLDVVGAPAGAAPYHDIRRRSIVGHVGGVEVRIAGLDDLIAMKRAAGRPLDLQDIADLVASNDPDARTTSPSAEDGE